MGHKEQMEHKAQLELKEQTDQKGHKEIQELKEPLELKAQLLNELGVLHQRQDDLEKARFYHEQSLDICEQLLELDVVRVRRLE